jgi:hypothetical protein
MTTPARAVDSRYTSTPPVSRGVGIVLSFTDDALTIGLHGEIAEILKLSAGGKRHGAETGEAAKQ